MKKLTALILTVLMLASAAYAEGTLAGGWTASEDPAVTEISEPAEEAAAEIPQTGEEIAPEL